MQIIVEKARLVEQNNLLTRQQLEEKDEAIELLKTEAGRLLKGRDDAIDVLQAQVWNLFDMSASNLVRLFQ